jgi:hypothetical protein
VGMESGELDGECRDAIRTFVTRHRGPNAVY